MIEMLEALGISPITVVLVAVASAAIFIAMYRKYAVSIFEPISIFIISSIASTTLMLSMNGWSGWLKLEYVIFVVFFWFGFRKTGRITKRTQTFRFSSNELFLLESVVLLFLIVIASANFYLGLKTGLPLLSADPTAAKVEYFTGGLGLIKRIDGAPFVFFASSCTLLIALGYKRRRHILFLILGAFLIALGGSKGALLPILFIVTFAFAHQGIRSATEIPRTFGRYAFAILCFALLLALIVEAKQGGGIQAGITLLFQRVLYYGDVVIYYYPSRGTIPELSHLNVLDYIKYLTANTLALMRVIHYPPALGSVILGDPDSGFGPNAQYFVRADIFFGPILGCLYCYLNGYVIGRLRKMFFEYGRGNIMSLALRLMLAVSAFNIATESSLFVSSLVDAAIIVIPIWGLASLMRSAVTAPGLRHPLEYKGEL